MGGGGGPGRCHPPLPAEDEDDSRPKETLHHHHPRHPHRLYSRPLPFSLLLPSPPHSSTAAASSGEGENPPVWSYTGIGPHEEIRPCPLRVERSHEDLPPVVVVKLLASSDALDRPLPEGEASPTAEEMMGGPSHPSGPDNTTLRKSEDPSKTKKKDSSADRTRLASTYASNTRARPTPLSSPSFDLPTPSAPSLVSLSAIASHTSRPFFAPSPLDHKRPWRPSSSNTPRKEERKTACEKGKRGSPPHEGRPPTENSKPPRPSTKRGPQPLSHPVEKCRSSRSGSSGRSRESKSPEEEMVVVVGQEETSEKNIQKKEEKEEEEAAAPQRIASTIATLMKDICRRRRSSTGSGVEMDQMFPSSAEPKEEPPPYPTMFSSSFSLSVVPASTAFYDQKAFGNEAVEEGGGESASPTTQKSIPKSAWENRFLDEKKKEGGEEAEGVPISSLFSVISSPLHWEGEEMLVPTPPQPPTIPSHRGPLRHPQSIAIGSDEHPFLSPHRRSTVTTSLDGYPPFFFRAQKYQLSPPPPPPPYLFHPVPPFPNENIRREGESNKAEEDEGEEEGGGEGEGGVPSSGGCSGRSQKTSSDGIPAMLSKPFLRPSVIFPSLGASRSWLDHHDLQGFSTSSSSSSNRYPPLLRSSLSLRLTPFSRLRSRNDGESDGWEGGGSGGMRSTLRPVSGATGRRRSSSSVTMGGGGGGPGKWSFSSRVRTPSTLTPLQSSDVCGGFLPYHFLFPPLPSSHQFSYKDGMRFSSPSPEILEEVPVIKDHDALHRQENSEKNDDRSA